MIGLSLVISGAFCVLKSFIPRHSSNIEAESIFFGQGKAFEKPLTVEKSTRYNVELFVEANGDYDNAGCLLTGKKNFTDPCDALSNFDLQIDLIKNNEVVDSLHIQGSDQPSLIGDGMVYRNLCRFDLESDEDYVLKIQSLKDYSVLDQLNPRINVIAPFFRNETYYRKLIFRCVGSLLLFIGFVLILRKLIQLKFKKKTV